MWLALGLEFRLLQPHPGASSLICRHENNSSSLKNILDLADGVDPRMSPILISRDRSGGNTRSAGQIPHAPAKRRPRQAHLQSRDHSFPKETNSS